MQKTLFITALLLLTALTACKKKNETVYEGCCGAEAIADTVHLAIKWPDNNGGTFDTTVVGRIYIPNIFIPSNQGENSFFMPFTNEWVKQIVSSKYFSEIGILYYLYENSQPNDVSAAWLGQKGDGTFHKGPFEYEITVEYIDGQVRTYTGSACAFQCGDSNFPKNHLPDCLFPVQNNGNGEPDKKLPQPYTCF